MPFFVFKQTMTGGVCIGNCDVGELTIVEARNAAEANARAELLGISRRR